MTAATRLLSQTEARDEARRLNAEHPITGLVAVASPYPLNSWGGAEQGWTVTYLPADPFRR